MSVVVLPDIVQAHSVRRRRFSRPHQARCGTCRHWLIVTEVELLASLDHPLICWICDPTVRSLQ